MQRMQCTWSAIAVSVCFSVAALSSAFAGERTRKPDPTHRPTRTPIGNSEPTPNPTSALIGDCDGSERVEVSELVLGVNIALERAALGQCPNLDTNADAKASVDELILAVANAFNPTHLLPCGDGERKVTEQCDDGNRVNGDGCSDACAIEGGPLLDQIWVGAPPDCAGFATINLAYGPVGQEFRPTLPSLTGVSVNLLSAVSDRQGGTVGVNLRRGSLDGAIIATAETPLASPVPPGSWQRFDFVLPVAVIPEQTYVIELFSGEDRLLWISGRGHEGCPEEHYERGDAVRDGERDSADDFLFAVFGTSDPGVGPID